MLLTNLATLSSSPGTTTLPSGVPAFVLFHYHRLPSCYIIIITIIAIIIFNAIIFFLIIHHHQNNHQSCPWPSPIVIIYCTEKYLVAVDAKRTLGWGVRSWSAMCRRWSSWWAERRRRRSRWCIRLPSSMFFLSIMRIVRILKNMRTRSRTTYGRHDHIMLITNIYNTEQSLLS